MRAVCRLDGRLLQVQQHSLTVQTAAVRADAALHVAVTCTCQLGFGLPHQALAAKCRGGGPRGARLRERAWECAAPKTLLCLTAAA